MNSGLFAAGLVELGVGAIYALVGARLGRRRVLGPAALASYQFTIWWYGLSLSSAISGLESGLIAFQSLSFPAALTLYLLTLLIDCALLWGLVGYLSYIYTGRSLLFPLSAFYAALYVVALFYVIQQGPNGVRVVSGIPTIVYAGMPNPILQAFIIVGIIVPEFGGTLLYLSLLRKARDPTQRYRIKLVGFGILLWLGSALVVSPSNAVDPVVWTIARTLLEALAAIIVLLAYLPTAAIQRRWGVHPIEAGDSG
ncbi:MAG TPA: hypothetical protein VGV64_02880 [Thermoplasmata archaeon]|nr:hypothetical protein [Thermoplasmata archaeon]